MDKGKLKKVAGISAVALGTAFVGLSVYAKMKWGSSRYDDAPEEKNPMAGKKVIFAADEHDAENADGVKGHLEAVGTSEQKTGIYDRYIKRSIDVILSFAGLTVLAPLYLGISAAIKLDDPGPVFFTQKRVGQNKEYFKLHKFRSMKMSTPHDVPTHMLENPDQYITRVGRFLRKYSLDELPQIWDIFVGNMSLIGPRPGLWNQDLLTAERDKYGANEVKPGLTGWAQINGRDELEIPVKAKLDGEYVRRESLAFDLKCFLGTVKSVLKHDGVVEGGTGELCRGKCGARKVAIVSCFDTQRDRIHLLHRYFTSRGDQATVFLSDYQHVAKEYAAECPDGYELIHARAYHRNLSVARLHSHILFSKAVRERLSQERWDIVWVLVPPNSLVKACAKYRAEHPETRLIYDINDLWPESMPINKGKNLPPFRLWGALRDRYLDRADFIVTECGLFRQTLKLSEKPIPSKVIYLCKEWDQMPAYQAGTLEHGNAVSLCYLGSINNIIDIDAITEIIRLLSSERAVTLHIIGDGEHRDEFMDRCRSAGAEVRFHGSFYDAASKQKIFDQCHFGLNVMKSSVCVGMTMKSLDYLAGGLPILNTIPGDMWELLDRYQVGINVARNQPFDLEQFDFIHARQAARELFESQFSYEAFAASADEVIRIMEQEHSD